MRLRLPLNLASIPQRLTQACSPATRSPNLCASPILSPTHPQPSCVVGQQRQ